MAQTPVSNTIKKVEESAFAGKYLTFYIDKNIYGLPIDSVLEIIGVQVATSVPGIPSFVKGIINLRGRIVPVIDARLKIGAKEAEYDERTCIVVINWQDSLVGLIVDRVAEVSDFKSEQISEIPDFSGINANKYLSTICRVGDSLVLVLDCDKFLMDDFAQPVAAMI